MNPKKQKTKDRRRARKLAEQAWEAVDAGNLDLAEKIVRRAVAAQMDNPVLWVDQGLILGLRGKEAESADAFRAAISLAPTFADPYAHLAALRIRQGFSAEAVALQTQAVKHTPDELAARECPGPGVVRVGTPFLFCDVPERWKSRRRSIAAGLGDAVLFCTRDRVVRVGDTYGLQPVKHGAARVTAGTRFVLGVPFHEYR
jgi:tetratricopeptide (TPR) repeat protein